MATINPSNLLNSLSQIIEERLSPMAEQSLPGLDEVYASFSTTTMGVQAPGTALGRDYKVIHTFIEGLSGAFKWVNTGGPQPGQKANAHIVYPGNVEEFPGLDETTTPGFLHQEITLSKGLGNMFVPQEYARADNLDASMLEAVRLIIDGTARNVALAQIHCFYALDSQKAIGTVGNVGSVSGDRITGVEIYNESVRGLHSGMAVDIYNAAGTVKRNSGYMMFIDGMRPLAQTTDDGYGSINLRRADGGTAPTLTATDIIVRADSLNLGPQGPEEWLVNTGTIFTNINVAEYEQFQSLVEANGGNALNEEDFNKWNGRFQKAYGAENSIDTWITSCGVVNAAVDQGFNGLTSGFDFRAERQGQFFKPNFGYDLEEKPVMTPSGQRQRIIKSDFMPSASQMSGTTNGGRMWGLKTRDENLKRYLAPTVSGSRTMSEMGAGIEFLYALGLGEGGVFKPYHSQNGNSTNYMEAPFYHYTATAPRFIPGVKITGLLEVL